MNGYYLTAVNGGGIGGPSTMPIQTDASKQTPWMGMCLCAAGAVVDSVGVLEKGPTKGFWNLLKTIGGADLVWGECLATAGMEFRSSRPDKVVLK